MKKTPKFIKKEHYEYLSQFEDKMKESVRVGTIRGYDRSDLKQFEAIYKTYGGDKSKSISQCNSCAFTILKNLLSKTKAYEDRYFSKDTKKDETSSNETEEEKSND